NAYKLDSLNNELEHRSFTHYSKREEKFTGKRFGDNPNNNPNCGRKIKVTRDSKSVIVTVVDRSALNQLADPLEGRVERTWEFLS
ncbi:18729_t:CDS:2, partial [Dentiscutata erythropus]